MKPWNVLVVDDDKEVLQAHGVYFECMGHHVTMHSCSLDACECLKRREPVDLLVTDFMMPDMNGLELVQQARSSGYLGPALMISAYHGGINASEAGELALDVMAKPVRYYELVAYVERLQGVDNPS